MMRHAPLQGIVASYFGFMQALATTAAHRPTEYEHRKRHCVRMMFNISIGGTDPDVPGSEIKTHKTLHEDLMKDAYSQTTQVDPSPAFLRKVSSHLLADSSARDRRAGAA